MQTKILYEDIIAKFELPPLNIGIYVPALPPKYIQPAGKGSSADEYIKERTHGLSIFCEVFPTQTLTHPNKQISLNALSLSRPLLPLPGCATTATGRSS